MSAPANTTSSPMSSTTSPPKVALTANQQKNGQKNGVKKRKRDDKAFKTEHNTQTGHTVLARPVWQLQRHDALGVAESGSHSKKQETIKQQMAEEKMVVEELPVVKKMKLDVLEVKIQELQGYVNQLQDAVTIGMYQLRDLKERVNAATSDLK
ncbi:hypothetical protein F5Y01DRAFT_313800 [Xylaria sp. FL0043]|nr:hypothetical protein F5Y01DRAFT_313800 [Xylaria sp. FL0043]